MKGDRHKAMEAGRDGFAGKPIQTGELFSEMKRPLEKRDAREPSEASQPEAADEASPPPSRSSGNTVPDANSSGDMPRDPDVHEETVTGHPLPEGAFSEGSVPEESVDEMMEFMEELRREYMAEFHEVIEECEGLVSAHDTKALEGIGHRLKGNGSSFGFDHVSEIGGEMEEAGKDDDFEAVVRCVDKLREIQAEFDQLSGTTSSSPS